MIVSITSGYGHNTYMATAVVVVVAKALAVMLAVAVIVNSWLLSTAHKIRPYAPTRCRTWFLYHICHQYTPGVQECSFTTKLSHLNHVKVKPLHVTHIKNSPCSLSNPSYSSR